MPLKVNWMMVTILGVVIVGGCVSLALNDKVAAYSMFGIALGLMGKPPIELPEAPKGPKK